MRTLPEIEALLAEIEHRTADELEGQDLDFKEWPGRNLKKGVDLVVSMAVCMANGGGGTVVFGVADREAGRVKAIKGVPPEIDVNRLKKTVYDSTDPKLTPVFEELRVPEGTERLVVMQVHPGIPPYTDTAGRGTIRVGKDCQPLTGSMRKRVMVETGETDYTAEVVPGPLTANLSPAAMEHLRAAALQERAPEDLVGLADAELLGALGVVKGGQLTRAGLLLAGKEETIREHVPTYLWTHLRMRTDTDYTDRVDGHEALPLAIARLIDRVMADNPISTIKQGLFHFEYRTYPEIALREAVMNAFCHADLHLASPVLIKQHHDRIEISNPGGFIGGVSPENILHHAPVARNPHLVDALTRLRLVNRSNLGVQRMFQALLIEGKEPPIIEGQGDVVKVTFLAGELSASFREFVAAEEQRGRQLGVDHLLVLRHLLRHPELDTATAARICQRSEAEARELLSAIELNLGYLERGGTGRGTFWRLVGSLHTDLAAPGLPERDRRIDWETAKTRLLDIVRQRAARGEPGLTNEEARAISMLGRPQIKRLMQQLRDEGHVEVVGRGRASRWVYTPPAD